MKTRQDYISGKVGHREYYSQFVNDNIKLMVKDRIGFKKCEKIIDKYKGSKMRKLIKQIKREIKKDLLPKLKLFKNFKVVEIYKEAPYLGYYKRGSYDLPIIKLNIPEIKECICDKTSLDLIIETTILHELGHAIQEYKGRVFDEEEAEEFAYSYYYERIIKI